MFEDFDTMFGKRFSIEDDEKIYNQINSYVNFLKCEKGVLIGPFENELFVFHYYEGKSFKEIIGEFRMGLICFKVNRLMAKK